jgi:hypothetical protein
MVAVAERARATLVEASEAADVAYRREGFANEERFL